MKLAGSHSISSPSIFLAAVLIIWTSIWYFGYAIHYDRLAKPLEKVSDQVAAMTTAGHTLEIGEHRIVLKHPGFLGEGGFLFSEIFLPESGASKVYLLGAVLGVAAGIYFVRRIMRIKKRLRTLGFRKGEPS